MFVGLIKEETFKWDKSSTFNFLKWRKNPTYHERNIFFTAFLINNANVGIKILIPLTEKFDLTANFCQLLHKGTQDVVYHVLLGPQGKKI